MIAPGTPTVLLVSLRLRVIQRGAVAPDRDLVPLPEIRREPGLIRLTLVVRAVAPALPRIRRKVSPVLLIRPDGLAERRFSRIAPGRTAHA